MSDRHPSCKTGQIRILFLGTFSGLGDEALSGISKKFNHHFRDKYEVMALFPGALKRPEIIKDILYFRPHIIHHLTGPTIRSFLLPWFVQLLSRHKPIIILSATRVYLGPLERKIIKYFKPDIILTQASKWENVFQDNGIRTEYIPNFIECKKFTKLSVPKEKLREKYGLPLNKKIFLHVGHIKKNRKLEFFIKLQKWGQDKGYQTLIVGGTFFDRDDSLLAELRQNGCIIINDYLENIEEVYNACDYYVFPMDGLSVDYFPRSYYEVGVTDIPLSILEALACSLPVMSTEVDALDVLLKDISKPPVVQFSSNMDSFKKALHQLNSQNFDYSTISKKIDQNTVLDRIENIYKELLGPI